MNGARGKLRRLLADPTVSVVVVEHTDRLARVNGELVEAALSAHGRRLVVLDGGEVDDDLVRDTVDVLTSFCARRYGRRSARNRAEKALRCAERDVGPMALSHMLHHDAEVLRSLGAALGSLARLSEEMDAVVGCRLVVGAGQLTLPPRPRRLSVVATEGCGEGVGRAVAGEVGDVREGQLAGAQVVSGESHPPVGQVLHGCLAEPLSEGSREGRPR
jgi:hypothetical protein